MGQGREVVVSKVYIKEWSGRKEALQELENLDIPDSLYDALVVAMEHRSQLNYDSLADYYEHEATPQVRGLMEKIGVVIVTDSSC